MFFSPEKQTFFSQTWKQTSIFEPNYFFRAKLRFLRQISFWDTFRFETVFVLNKKLCFFWENVRFFTSFVFKDNFHLLRQTSVFETNFVLRHILLWGNVRFWIQTLFFGMMFVFCEKLRFLRQISFFETNFVFETNLCFWKRNEFFWVEVYYQNDSYFWAIFLVVKTADYLFGGKKLVGALSRPLRYKYSISGWSKFITRVSPVFQFHKNTAVKNTQ